MKPEARRFVLADPSISSGKGHYLEYALRVLNAVRREGSWEPVLVANQKFGAGSLSRHEVEVDSAFTYDIWGRRPPGPMKMKDEAARSSFYRHRVGRAGLLWSLSADLGVVREFSERSGMSPHQLRWLEKAITLRWHVERLPREDDETEDSLIARVLSGERAPASDAPPLHALGNIESLVNKARTFRLELTGMIDRLQLGAEDFIFMPTMGWHDLAGLSEWLKFAPVDTMPRFGLLFRRNIYTCYAHEFHEHGFDVHDLRVAFDRLASSDINKRVTLYTDTDELTAEYDSISDRSFYTLPIPAPAIEEADTKSRVVKVRHSLVYLGDAREEKGFQYLPALLSAEVARQKQGVQPRLRLKAQCYFAPGFDDANIIAAAAIVRNYAPNVCDVIEGVLDGDAYEKAIREADAILVPYNRSNYISRSSGIFIEAIAARKPVVVSAGTSMANFLDSMSFDYHKRSVLASDIIGQYGSNAVNWEWLESHKPAEVNAKNEPRIRSGRTTFCTVAKPRMATHLWINFKITDVPSVFAQLLLVARDAAGEALTPHMPVALGGGEARRSIILPVPKGAQDIGLTVSNPFSTASFALEDINLSWLSLSRPIARTAGGVTFINDYADDQRKRQFINAVQVLEGDFSAYEDSMAEIGSRVAQFHNADRLLAEALFAAGVEMQVATKSSSLTRRRSS